MCECMKFKLILTPVISNTVKRIHLDVQWCHAEGIGAQPEEHCVPKRRESL